MAGHLTTIAGCPCFIDYADAYHEVTIGRTVWRWDFHDYLGPTFLKANGEPRKCQCPTVKSLWEEFNAWLETHKKAKQTAKTPCPSRHPPSPRPPRQ